MGKRNPRVVARERRKMSLRKKVRGTPERPRLCVYCSGRHVYAQIIDDESGRTLAAASTLSPELRSQGKVGSNIASAIKVGEAIAAAGLAANVKKVVFDRNGFIYHGKVKALGDAARKGGLEF